MEKRDRVCSCVMDATVALSLVMDASSISSNGC